MAKYALCIGINDYPGTEMDLQGCVNDARDWAAELQRRGFETTLLLDEQATKAALVDAMRTVIGRGRAGDVVAITFAGHGTYVYDGDAEEDDGFDEALCPHDIEATGDPLLDDEIHDLLRARGPGVRLLLVADSCHSGTVSRAAASRGGVTVRRRFLPMGNWMRPQALARAAAAAPPAAAPGAPPGHPSAFAKAARDALDDVLLSGCMEGKTNFSYDAEIAGRANGAFTHFALQALRALPPGASYADWYAAITPEHLPSPDFPQTPQLVATPTAAQRPVLD